MTKISARNRYSRVKLAGANTLNYDEWQHIVDLAIMIAKDTKSYYPDDPRRKMVVDAQYILDVEADLTEAEELQRVQDDEFRRLRSMHDALVQWRADVNAETLSSGWTIIEKIDALLKIASPK